MLFYQPYCRRGKGKKILGGPKIAKISYCGHSSGHCMKKANGLPFPQKCAILEIDW